MTSIGASLRVLHRGFQGFDLAACCEGLAGLELVAAGDEAEVVRQVAGCDALFINSPGYTETIARAACAPGSRLRWIQFTSSGTETAHLWGVPAGAVVSNAASAWAPTVAEHGVALILALMRQVHVLERDRAAGRWDRAPLLRGLATLEGARVGLLGYGAIAQNMAARLAPFGARILGFGRSNAARPHAHEMHASGDLATIAPSLDVLCSVIPLAADTRNIIDGAILDLLPRHALVLNLGRGGTLDQAALAERLAGGRIAGAALDVFAPEPLPGSSPLWGLANVIISPHLGAFGGAAGWRRLAELCRENMRRFQDGATLHNVVAIRAAPSGGTARGEADS